MTVDFPMRDDLAFRPSEMGAGWYIRADCRVCGESRYFGPALLTEKAGDVPLNRIEPRVRCVARPRLNKRGPACGGRMLMHPCPPLASNEYHPHHGKPGRP